MAGALGVSAAYVNLLENNQRSLSVKVLMALTEVYRVEGRDLVKDETLNLLPDLRHVMRDPVFGDERPDLQELRAAIVHAPRLVECLLRLHRGHRAAMDKIMRQGTGVAQELLALSPEAVIHDFFRSNANYFDPLERAAEALRSAEPCDADETYAVLKSRLEREHGVAVCTRTVEQMDGALRIYHRDAAVVHLSEALDHHNRVFQLGHVLCLVEMPELLDRLTTNSGVASDVGLARCFVELANYFAAAFLMPYEPFLQAAQQSRYDVDRISAAFGVSFEQVCHRLTTLQRPGMRGIPFFFLRVDKAGNVTKRFNSTTFNLAAYGGSCPVWNLHTAFRTPGVILLQFVEPPDGERFFTISRTTERPIFSQECQDRRLAVALKSELHYAEAIGCTATFNLRETRLLARSASAATRVSATPVPGGRIGLCSWTFPWTRADAARRATRASAPGIPHTRSSLPWLVSARRRSRMERSGQGSRKDDGSGETQSP